VGQVACLIIRPCQDGGESNKGSQNAGNNDDGFDGHDELLVMMKQYRPSPACHIDLRQTSQIKSFRARL
jgi:hypothetical protein